MGKKMGIEQAVDVVTTTVADTIMPVVREQLGLDIESDSVRNTMLLVDIFRAKTRRCYLEGDTALARMFRVLEVQTTDNLLHQVGLNDPDLDDKLREAVSNSDELTEAMDVIKKADTILMSAVAPENYTPVSEREKEVEIIQMASGPKKPNMDKVHDPGDFDTVQDAETFLALVAKGVTTLPKLTAEHPIICQIEGCPTCMAKADLAHPVEDVKSGRCGIVCSRHASMIALQNHRHAEGEAVKDCEDNNTLLDEATFNDLLSQYQELVNDFSQKVRERDRTADDYNQLLELKNSAEQELKELKKLKVTNPATLKDAIEDAEANAKDADEALTTALVEASEAEQELQKADKDLAAFSSVAKETISDRIGSGGDAVHSETERYMMLLESQLTPTEYSAVMAESIRDAGVERFVKNGEYSKALDRTKKLCEKDGRDFAKGMKELETRARNKVATAKSDAKVSGTAKKTTVSKKNKGLGKPEVVRTKSNPTGEPAEFAKTKPTQKCPCGTTNRQYRNCCAKAHSFFFNRDGVPSSKSSGLLRYDELTPEAQATAQEYLKPRK